MKAIITIIIVIAIVCIIVYAAQRIDQVYPTSNNSVSLKEFYKNPEVYIGKEITITGEYGDMNTFCDGSSIALLQGPIGIHLHPSSRSAYKPGYTYTVTGQVQKDFQGCYILIGS